MINWIRFNLNGQPAVVRFVSRYRDENHYEVSQAGNDGRVAKFDDGRIVSRCEHWTDEDAVVAIAAYEEHDAQEYERWAAQRGILTK